MLALQKRTDAVAFLLETIPVESPHYTCRRNALAACFEIYRWDV
jgi:hypothetical protein